MVDNKNILFGGEIVLIFVVLVFVVVMFFVGGVMGYMVGKVQIVIDSVSGLDGVDCVFDVIVEDWKYYEL